MMKKFAVAATVATMVGMSSICFAGFGLPKVGGAATVKSPAAATSSESKSTVDTSDITSKQAEVLKYLKGAMLAQVKAYQVVDEALGQSDPELAQVAASLTGKSGTKEVKAAQSILAKRDKQLLSAEARKNIDKNKVQVDKLAAAIKTGKAYQQAANINYVVVATKVPAALQEATSALKSAGSNPMALGKINGAIATFKLGSEIASNSKAAIYKYNDAVDAMKSDYGVSDEAIKNAKVADAESIANECLNIVK